MIHLSLRRCFLLLFVALIMLSTLMIIFPRTALAHTITPAQSAAGEGHVTIIVLDMSGSMGSNDPQGLRCSAANAYIDLSGLNDYIGVVGLDNSNGSRTGVHNFLTAQEWTQPLNTATVAERSQLRTIIASKSNGCRPDNNTPTYDALNQALGMLTTASKGKQLTGSVILLTDGVPDPDTNEQINAIKSDLVPQFKTHNWPIDTIALGPDGTVAGTNTTFHDFLGTGIANATGGKFYDDNKGAVPGISPLNIAPFFVDIFARRTGRTVSRDIPPATLDGGTSKRNFFVPDFANTLDVVVVKDQPGTTVTLIDPNGQRFTGSSGGTLFSKDQYYNIFSINLPAVGQWEADVTGSGQFLLDSLKTSDIGITIDTVGVEGSTIPANNPLPLGQVLNITAYLTSNGQPVTTENFQINGTLSYTGNAGQFSEQFTLNDKARAGTFLGVVSVPTSAPAGSYDIKVDASQGSGTNLIASGLRSARLELFPLPFFLANQTNKPTDGSVNATAIQWPAPLSAIYSWPVLSGLSGWPLQNHPPQALTTIPGEVQWQGKLYSSADINALAYNGSSKTWNNVTIIKSGSGTFQAQFIAPGSGLYQVVFQTSGTYKDSHGDFGPTTRYVQVSVVPATGSQVVQAISVTLFYLALFVFIIFLFKFFLTPRPFGEWTRVQDGEFAGGLRFNRAHRNPWQWFFVRNTLYSRQASMPKGLKFRFRYGGNIEVRSEGPGSADWQLGDGGRVRSTYQRVRDLVFYPRGSADMGEEEVSRYTINSQVNKKSVDEDGYDYSTRSASRSSRSKRRPAASTSSYSFYDDENEPTTRRKPRKTARRGKNVRREDDYY